MTIQPQHTKHYYHFVMLSVLFAVILIPTTGKTIDFFGTPLSIGIFYFPFIYIVADVLTEVYGYALARRALWYSIIGQVVTIIVFQIVAYFPPSVTMQNNEAFVQVLSQAPVFVVVGIVAIFLGDITNNYVLAKMKIRNGGDNMAGRFVASTAVGEVVNTAFFYFFALVLTGVIPLNAALASIATSSVIKVAVEILMLPVTVKVARKIKAVEGIDAFDTHTNFNPLKF